MIRGALATAAVAAALLLVACGGETTPADYASQLDDACTELQSKLADAAAGTEEQDVSAGELSQQYATEFRGEVEDLEPPAELEQDDQLLRDTLDSAPTDGTAPEQAIAYHKKLGALYSDLGAEECAAAQDDAVKSLGQLKNGIFETGGQSG